MIKNNAPPENDPALPLDALPPGRLKISPRGVCLARAEDAIGGERVSTYGTPENNFGDIAALWNALGVRRRHPGNAPLATLGASDVAQMMVAFKLARLRTTPDHADSWVDIAGYAACGYEVSGVARLGVEPPEPTSKP